MSDRLERLRSFPLYAPARTQIDPERLTGLWAAPIDGLLAAGYMFLPSQFSEDGYLFRALGSGLARALSSGEFRHAVDINAEETADDLHETQFVEALMDIYFVSHEISDALTVSRLESGPADGAILVLRAALFQQQLAQRQAAVMAIGDGGIVFRYPFLVQPLTAADIECVVVAERVTVENVPEERIVRLAPAERTEFEARLKIELERRNIVAATPARCDEHPTRS